MAHASPGARFHCGIIRTIVKYRFSVPQCWAHCNGRARHNAAALRNPSESFVNATQKHISLAAAGLLLAAGTCIAQGIDPDLERQIAAVQAIDNHAHPVLAPPLEATDREFDALPVSNLEPQSDPVAVRPDFPLLGAAWKALYGFETPPPLDDQGLKQLNAARSRVEALEGEHFPSWVLDQAGIATMLANRVAMGRGVQPPRFRWVPYADALLFPLDNTGLAAASPDRKEFFALENIVRSRYLKEAV